MSESEKSVVIPHQYAVEVFVNDSGGITIRQEAFGDEPDIVIIAPENAAKLARAIRAAAAEFKRITTNA